VVIPTITTYRKVGAFYIACNGDPVTGKDCSGFLPIRIRGQPHSSHEL